jgi:hypothetical protein
MRDFEKGVIKTGLLLLPLLALAAVWLAIREPTHDGRSLTAWLERVQSASSIEEATRYTDEIQAMGTRALPWLLRYIQPGQERTTRAWKLLLTARSFLADHHMLKLPTSHDPAWLRASAILTLTHFNPREVEPLLLQFRFSEGSWGEMHGEEALAILGPVSSNALVRACGSSNVIVRAKAAEMLVRVTQPGIRQPGWYVRPGTGPICPIGDFPQVKAALHGFAQDSNPAIRRASADALVFFSKWEANVQAEMDHRRSNALARFPLHSDANLQQ